MPDDLIVGHHPVVFGKGRAKVTGRFLGLEFNDLWVVSASGGRQIAADRDVFANEQAVVVDNE